MVWNEPEKNRRDVDMLNRDTEVQRCWAQALRRKTLWN
jgi:hypothetical protein